MKRELFRLLGHHKGLELSATVPTVMRALHQKSVGGPPDLQMITDTAVPQPGPGEVLIRVKAAGINFVDVSQAEGIFAGGPEAPYVAGIEGVGEVVAFGEGVATLEIGAHVVGVNIRGGAFAEYMVMPAVAAMAVPSGWSDEQALGLVVGWPTALAALKPLGRIATGETVLIHAAAGGTGQVAVRLAKHYGATVVAATSSDKHEMLRGLGADYVVDSRSGDLSDEVFRVTEGLGVDLVLESVGGRTLEQSLAVAKRVTGRVVVFGMAGGEASISNWDLIYKHQVHVIGLNIGILIQKAPHIFGEVMGEMFGLIASGVLQPISPTIYSLDDGQTAFSDLLARTTVGKLALLP